VTITTLFALLAAGGVLLLFSGLVMPRHVRLTQPASARGLASLQARLTAAELPVSANEFLNVCLIAAAISVVAAFLLGAPAFALAGLTIAPALVWQRYESQRDKFRQAYDESLAECLQLVREGFGVTAALKAALQHAANNGPDPAAADFRQVLLGLETGQSFSDAFAEVIARRRNPYVRMVAEALSLKTTEGGSVSDILLGLETMVRDQVVLRREIVAKQAQARLESMVISLAPIGFFVLMKLVPWMRAYEDGFYSTLLGQIALTVVLMFSAAAFFLARRLATRGLTLEVKEVAT
jgi:Flp pilus assembly protein TadB